jgi:hypothetical protein
MRVLAALALQDAKFHHWKKVTGSKELAPQPLLPIPAGKDTAPLAALRTAPEYNNTTQKPEHPEIDKMLRF